MAADVLSAAMVAVLRTVAAGDPIDGRSWRTQLSLERRGLLTPGGRHLTDAGKLALDEEDR